MGSRMGWYPQGCGQVAMAARVMQLGWSDKQGEGVGILRYPG